MSIALMTIAWALEINSTDKLVLLALADNANDAGCCWPSMSTIARKCGLKERATRLAMRRLETAGHVSSVDRSGTSRLYTVHPGISCPPASDAARHDMPVTPVPRAPKPSRTTISSTKTTSSPKKKSARASVSIELPDWVPLDAWNGWLEMRKAKGSKETARALTLAIEELRKLADAGHPPGAVLDQSTFRRWAGLFPIKDNHNGLSQRTNGLGGDHRSGAGRDRPVDGFTAALREASARFQTDEYGGGHRTS